MIAMLDVIPVFKVDDVTATLYWYRDKLGFAIDGFPDAPPYVFGFLRAGPVEMFVQTAKGYQRQVAPPLGLDECWDAYIRMTGLLEYYERIRANVKVLSAPVRREYGQTEFKVEDCNGYVLVFAERIA